ncbi:D-alanyl-D-alanine carboxypeptidase/D-alanyl-D-alanine endopeptidase [Streptomyces sp. NBC_00151]|uniref:D-alanyl-D-alanine carboxypeptidase/D-alanyl-D-alanine endopeptidase n=1 Tax=Streptomyces sp. NBC_00151 TaxID=2975669 RepID=UPI002DDC16FC|nr:D-alanyl-D-alanine carboxypeptidase/D-alanyl-D-alanine-endopeptidase [Streptomyces sp. NBC_00151]WRZ37072.1 D-alanyl-D-alanine carboxypeptidase/D-alanyl-D-alanine-endopeptidase [Streptomyces sp. NBC_00151]
MRPMICGRLRTWAGAGATLALLAGAAAAGTPAAAHDDDLGPAIEAIMHKPGYEHAQWGVLETDPETGRVIHSQFPNQFFVPGSTVKLVTISTAWHTLGPNHRFTTPVMATGTRTGSTLHGNLALVAQGDLTMGGRTKPDGSVDYTDIDHTEAAIPGATLTPENPLAGINKIARQIRDAGITRVDGNVIIDPRLFTPPALSPQPTPLILNDNLIDLLTTPTKPGQPAKLFWRPQVSPYHVTSTVRTVSSGGTTSVNVIASPDGTQIHLSGTIAAGSQPLLRVSNIQDPNAFGRTALIEALARVGVTVTAPPTGPNPQKELPASYRNTPRVAAYVSPPYSQYAKLILKVSHNLGANLALCNMAVARGSKNCFDAFPIEHDFLTNVARIDPKQFQLADGRGGVPAERVTPNGLVELLTYWLHTPDAEAFRSLLPILGVDGSNGISCTTDCPAKGKVFAKPGTIIGDDELNQELAATAQNEAGYLQTDDGRLLTFFVGVNGAATPDLQSFIGIFNDVNQITALLQEQASADEAHR